MPQILLESKRICTERVRLDRVRFLNERGESGDVWGPKCGKSYGRTQ